MNTVFIRNVIGVLILYRRLEVFGLDVFLNYRVFIDVYIL